MRDGFVPATANSEIADVLRAAHDEMLIRGRTVGRLVDADGRVCLMGAIEVACELEGWRDGILLDNPDNRANIVRANRAREAMTASGFTVEWNDDPARTTDDVLDAFLNTEKQLREENP